MSTIEDDEDEKQSDPLLQEYKMYVQMADNVSARRAQANAFFISVLSALLVFLSFIAGAEMSELTVSVGYVAISVLGILLCFVWYVNIASYRQLNSGKFKVIHEMEAKLPFQCYRREWEILGQGESSKKYLPLTHIERYIPLVLSIPFLLMLAYGIYSLVAA
jgi:hypothetical protein